MAFLFEKLDVYQASVDFASKAHDLTNEFKRLDYYIVDQLNRAALSICANIAEGNGRRHVADRKRFFVMSRGSTFECVAILEVCKRKSLILEEDSIAAKETLERIAQMLTKLIEAQ